MVHRSWVCVKTSWQWGTGVSGKGPSPNPLTPNLVCIVEFPVLLLNTILLRPYVFIFLAAFFLAAHRLLGWPRTLALFCITWVTAFLCEFSSTRTGFPFGWYSYTGSTVGKELYVADVPFMDSISFPVLLFASYSLALFFLLPQQERHHKTTRVPQLILAPAVRTSWPVYCLTVLFFVFIDVIIDPVALRGDRWFLGRIYGYPDPGVHFGVPLANYLGWGVVGSIALAGFYWIDRTWTSLATIPPEHHGKDRRTCPPDTSTGALLMGCALYGGVLVFNLSVTFWIGELLIGMTGLFIYIPLIALFALRVSGHFPSSREVLGQAMGEPPQSPHDSSQ